MIEVNYATLWERLAEALPNQLALWHDDRAITYHELDVRAARLAAGLRSAGLRSGDRLALYLYNGSEYIEAVFAAFKLGVVPVTVNYRYKERELGELLADAGAEALIFHRSLADQVRDVMRDGRVRLALVVDDAPALSVDGAVAYEELVKSSRPLPPGLRSGEDKLLLYTGGTTGLPKGVVWRQRDLFVGQLGMMYGDAAAPDDLMEAVALAREFVAEGSSPRLLPAVPLMHATGLLTTIATLSVGGMVVFAPGRSLDPAAVWRLIEKRRVTRLVVAGDAVARPLAHELERAACAGQPYAISSLSLVTSAGVAWSDDVKRTFLQHGNMALVELIASSEGGPYAISKVTSVRDLPSRWHLTPRTRVVDEHGRSVEPGSGRAGSFAYGGPMPLGYHGAPEASAAVFKEIDGARHVVPGDLARIAPDGSVEFLGRGATVVNSGGEKIFPAEVEQVLLEHPDVRDCAIVGVPDERWGEVVTAVVVLARRTTTAAALVDHVGHHLAGYKKPRRVVIVDRLPRGPNAKVDLAAVRSLASSEVLGAGTAVGT